LDHWAESLSLLGLFVKKSPLDEWSSQWLFDAFGWALENFDAGFFHHHTVLVLPNNQFFPGRADSVDAMANLIFDQVKRYAGMGHWPTRLEDQGSCSLAPPAQIDLGGELRKHEAIMPALAADAPRLQILYNPQQVSRPEGLIASFAHVLSHFLGQTADKPPPGGADYWPQVTELLAVYLGFGVMFANSAFTFKGGCGSCYNPNANRDAYLSELEATYALAIFCVLKGIQSSEVTPHLKKHLRGVFKSCLREIQDRGADMQRLRRASEAGVNAGAVSA
jgi:hypothetical protein